MGILYFVEAEIINTIKKTWTNKNKTINKEHRHWSFLC